MSEPTYIEHVVALAFIWATAAAIVLAGIVATLVALGAARLRRSRGGLGRWRVERVAP